MTESARCRTLGDVDSEMGDSVNLRSFDQSEAEWAHTQRCNIDEYASTDFGHYLPNSEMVDGGLRCFRWVA